MNTIFGFPVYLLHPIAVHFPIALLTLGFVLSLSSLRSKASPWVGQGAPWILWVGTLFAWVAFGLGFIAEDKAPRAASAWEAFLWHETLAYWTVGLFSFLSLWQLWFGSKWKKVFLGLWLIALGFLITTGYYGGKLVFVFRVGTFPVSP